jgi:hypothetical protein
LEISLGRENRAGESTCYHDQELRQQSDLHDLIKKQLPAKPVCENRPKCVKGEQHQFAQILKKRENRSSEGVEKSNNHAAAARELPRVWFRRFGAAESCSNPSGRRGKHPVQSFQRSLQASRTDAKKKANDCAKLGAE